MFSDDISELLARWPFEADAGLQVRRVAGSEGACVQVRVDLGLLQLRLEGRPDGEQPMGRPSLLDHYREQAEAHRAQFGWYEGFELDSDDCDELRRESLQYYHRRIALMALQDYEPAIADAYHNLQILDLLKAFARNSEDWLASEQYRAFITCHRIQCEALVHLQRNDPRQALVIIERGLREVREIFAEQDQFETFEESAEQGLLQDLRRRVEAQYQISHRQRLQILLDEALRREDPDVAAELRAQLRELEIDE
jgi:tetratricopeptide (TPR) repeat protein